MIGYENGLYDNPVWYKVDEKALTVDTVTIVVQVNGKVRAKIDMPADSEESVVKATVFADDKIKQYTEGKEIIKEIYIKNKIYTIVVKG